MFEDFASTRLLAERSPQSLMLNCVDIALRLATYGFIAQAAEIIDLADQLLPSRIDTRYLKTKGLYFAFEAANIWPAVVPEDHKTSEYLASLDNADISKWGTLHGNFDRESLQPLTLDEAGLKRLFDYLDTESKDRFTYPFQDESYVLLGRSAVRYRAIDLALRLERPEHKERAGILISTPGLDLKPLAQSRSAWRILSEGRLIPKGTSSFDVESEFNRLRDVLFQRRDHGPQRPFKDKAIHELVEIINKNTISHDHDEDTDDRQLEELMQQTLMGNRSIMREPAKSEDILQLEENLHVTLPQDYREFLEISNGLHGIWNGYFRQGFLGPLHDIKREEESLQGDDALSFSLANWEELEIEVDWPKLDLAQALSISDAEEEGNTWLVEPKLVQEAVKCFFKSYDNPDVAEKDKASAARVVSWYFGSLEEFRDMGWCLVTWTHWGITLEAWKSFKEYLETLALESK